MPQVIRAVFSKKNIRRAPGRSGQLNRCVEYCDTFEVKSLPNRSCRFTIDWHGTPRHLYINSKGMITPWPESLVVQVSCHQLFEVKKSVLTQCSVRRVTLLTTRTMLQCFAIRMTL